MGVLPVRWIPVAAVLVAVLSAVAIAVGAGLAYLPAGLIVAGLEGLAASYGALYVLAKWTAPTSPGRQ